MDCFTSQRLFFRKCDSASGAQKRSFQPFQGSEAKSCISYCSKWRKHQRSSGLFLIQICWLHCSTAWHLWQHLCPNIHDRCLEFDGKTLDICISHLEWQGDALCIYFSQIKQDQMGERPQDPRHLYANLLCLEICGMIALSIFWDCYAFEEGENTTLSRLHSRRQISQMKAKSPASPPPPQMHHYTNRDVIFLRNRHNNIKLRVTSESYTTFSMLS